MGDLVPRDERRLGSQRRGLAAGIIAPIERDAGFNRVRLGAERLRPGDEDGVGLAARDPLRHQVDEQLRRVPADRSVKLGPRRCAEAAGEAARQVGVGTERRGERRRRVGEQADDGDGVERDASPPGVNQCRCAGAREQVERRPGIGRVRCPIAGLTDADENGSAQIGHARHSGPAVGRVKGGDHPPHRHNLRINFHVN